MIGGGAFVAPASAVTTADGVTYSTKPPVTPSVKLLKPYRYEWSKREVEFAPQVTTHGKVEIKLVAMKAMHNGEVVGRATPDGHGPILGPGTYTLVSKLVWRGYSTTAQSTATIPDPRPSGIYPMKCTVGADDDNYMTGANDQIVAVNVPFMCTDAAWLGTFRLFLLGWPVRDDEGKLTGWNITWPSDSSDTSKAFLPYVPALANMNAKLEMGQLPVGYVLDSLTVPYSGSFLYQDKVIPVWVPAPRVNGPWQTVTRKDVVTVATPAPVYHAPPDSRACASRRDLYWVRTDGSMGPKKVATILGNRGVEVSHGWVDITGDNVPDAYQRVRWYAGCADNTVAQVKFYGTLTPLAGQKKMRTI